MKIYFLVFVSPCYNTRCQWCVGQDLLSECHVTCPRYGIGHVRINAIFSYLTVSSFSLSIMASIINIRPKLGYIRNVHVPSKSKEIKNHQNECNDYSKGCILFKSCNAKLLKTRRKVQLSVISRSFADFNAFTRRLSTNLLTYS